jgi:hypothetical protein
MKGLRKNIFYRECSTKKKKRKIDQMSVTPKIKGLMNEEVIV